MKIGFLPQEPQLDRKDRAQAVEEGIGEPCGEEAPRRDLRGRTRSPMRFRQARGRAGEARGDRQRRDADSTTCNWRSPPTRCAADVEQKIAPLSGGEKRRVALCRLLLSKPTSCCSMSPPTTSTRRASSGSSSSAQVSRYGGRGDARSLFSTTQPVDPRARPRLGIPGGQLLSWLEQKEMRLEVERSRSRRASSDAKGARMVRQNKAASEIEGAAGALRGAFLIRIPEAQRTQKFSSRRRSSRRFGDRVQGLSKGYGERCSSTTSPSACRPARSSASSAPRRRESTLFRMITQGKSGQGQDRHRPT